MDQSPQCAGPQASGGLVDRNDSTHFDRVPAGNHRIGIQDFEFGIDDLQITAAVGIKLEFSVKDDLLSPPEDLALLQIFRVKPLAANQTGLVAGGQLEDPEPSLAGSPQAGGQHLRQNGGLGSRLKVAHPAEAGAVLVAVGKGVEQVFDGVDVLGGKVLGSAGPHPLDELHRSL